MEVTVSRVGGGRLQGGGVCKGGGISRNMRIQQHKMSLPPLPTTTLAIVMSWVQRMGQILRHSKNVLQIVW